MGEDNKYPNQSLGKHRHCILFYKTLLKERKWDQKK